MEGSDAVMGVYLFLRRIVETEKSIYISHTNLIKLHSIGEALLALTILDYSPENYGGFRTWGWISMYPGPLFIQLETKTNETKREKRKKGNEV